MNEMKQMKYVKPISYVISLKKFDHGTKRGFKAMLNQQNIFEHGFIQCWFGLQGLNKYVLKYAPRYGEPKLTSIIL